MIMNGEALISATLTVAFQGVRGAFGEEAVCAYFEQEMGTQPEKYACHSFADVFVAVMAGTVDYGVVPLENSQTGGIDDVYDLLNQHDLFIVGEVSLPINQCLMCLPGQRLGDIKRVLSHAQALTQCEEYLQTLAVEVIAEYNTAGSAKMIREEDLRNTAAIAGKQAAELYQLDILASNIQTIKDNYTRFIVLGRVPLPRFAGDAKTMLTVAVKRQQEALSRCLAVFAAHNLSLLRVETRPSRQHAWEYVFFLEFTGHYKDPCISHALADLATTTSRYKFLGSFLRAI
jgi:prephenate dehydratase